MTRGARPCRGSRAPLWSVIRSAHFLVSCFCQPGLPSPTLKPQTLTLRASLTATCHKPIQSALPSSRSLSPPHLLPFPPRPASPPRDGRGWWKPRPSTPRSPPADARPPVPPLLKSSVANTSGLSSRCPSITGYNTRPGCIFHLVSLQNRAVPTPTPDVTRTLAWGCCLCSQGRVLSGMPCLVSA